MGRMILGLGILGLTGLSFTAAKDKKIRLLESFNPINSSSECGPPIGNCGFPIENEPSNVSLKIVDGWPGSTFDWPWSRDHHLRITPILSASRTLAANTASDLDRWVFR